MRIYAIIQPCKTVNLIRAYLTPQKTTVAQWLDEWLDTFAANKIKPTTYLHYQACIKNYIKPQIGAIELQALRGPHVQKVYNVMTKKGLSGKTVKNCAAVLHKALSVALKQGIIVSITPAIQRSSRRWYSAK